MSTAVLRSRIRNRRIRMFFGLLDPDLLEQGMDPDPMEKVILGEKLRQEKKQGKQKNGERYQNEGKRL